MSEKEWKAFYERNPYIFRDIARLEKELPTEEFIEQLRTFSRRDVQLLMGDMPQAAYYPQLDLHWWWGVEAVRMGNALPVQLMSKWKKYLIWAYLAEIRLEWAFDFVDRKEYGAATSTPNDWRDLAYAHAPMSVWYALS